MKGISRHRLLAYKLLTVSVVPLLALFLLELGLRAVGFGYSTKVFLEENGQARNNWSFSFKYFPWSMARPMGPHSFAKEKPADSIRIFVLGGSAAQGFPVRDYGIAGQLQTLLEEAYPDRGIEVINAAITAVNSHVVLSVAKACLEYDPDYLIVYAGNNEVVGPYGPGTGLTSIASHRGAIRVHAFLKSSRIFQLLFMAAGKHQTPYGSWRGMGMFLDKAIGREDPRLQGVYENFQANISAILEMAVSKDCEVILSTVGVNLYDNPPFYSLHDVPLTEMDISRWEAYIEEGKDWQSKGEYRNALASYIAANQLDDGYSEIHYRMGQCYLALNQLSLARGAFQLSIDSDALRFRADSQINSILRSIAHDESTEKPAFVDGFQLVADAQESRYDQVGEDVLYDHVHLSFSGNYLLAREFARRIITQVGTAKADLPSEEQTAALMGFGDLDRFNIAKKLSEELLDKPPFTKQFDFSERQRRLSRYTRKLEKSLDPSQLVSVGAHLQELLKKRPDDLSIWLRYSRLLNKRGMLDEARSILKSVIDQRPYDHEALLELSSLAMSRKEWDEAEESLSRILELNPYAIEVRSEYLRLLVLKGDLEAAEIYGEKLVSDHNRDPELKSLLGYVLAARGKQGESIDQFRRAVSIDPMQSQAWERMIQLLLQLGDVAVAKAEVMSWLRMVPSRADAHLMIADILSGENDKRAAIASYQRSLELDPDRVIARSRYLSLLVQMGEVATAIQFFQNQLKDDREIEDGFALLALAFDEAGSDGEAIDALENGLSLEPRNVNILRDLAWKYATSVESELRDGFRALELAGRAIKESPYQADIMQVLAAAFAENGEYQKASKTAQVALSLARKEGQSDLADFIEKCLEAYEKGQPIRVN